MKKEIRNANDFKQLGTIHNRAVAQTDLINEETRTIPFILVSNDNSGLRYDWWEDEIYEEKLIPDGATFDRLNTFFKDHRMSVDTAIGKVVNTRVENGQIKADVIFGSDTESQTIFNKFREGILTDVSIGYSIQDTKTTKREKDYPLVEVTRFDIHELSAVWKGFDKNAKVGRNADDSNLEKEVENNEENSDLLEAETSREKRARDLELIEKSIIIS